MATGRVSFRCVNGNVLAYFQGVDTYPDGYYRVTDCFSDGARCYFEFIAGYQDGVAVIMRGNTDYTEPCPCGVICKDDNQNPNYRSDVISTNVEIPSISRESIQNGAIIGPMGSAVALNVGVNTTKSGLQGGVVRNMNLPLSYSRPIQVTETTLNLQEIQNFPISGRGLDGTHFHQDPISGQTYVMSEELHQRIPQILKSRLVDYDTSSNGISNDKTNNLPIVETITISEDNLGVINLNSMENYVGVLSDVSTKKTYSNSSDLIGGMSLESTNIDVSDMIFDQSTYTDQNIVYDEYIKPIFPINRFTNISSLTPIFSNISQYIPINKFLNTNQSFDGTNLNGLNYTPINRFV